MRCFSTKPVIYDLSLSTLAAERREGVGVGGGKDDDKLSYRDRKSVFDVNPPNRTEQNLETEKLKSLTRVERDRPPRGTHRAKLARATRFLAPGRHRGGFGTQSDKTACQSSLKATVPTLPSGSLKPWQPPPKNNLSSFFCGINNVYTFIADLFSQLLVSISTSISNFPPRR